MADESQPKPLSGDDTGAEAGAAPVSIEDFAKLELRTAKVLSVVDHPKADRLLLLQVDVGEAEPRQIVAGIKGAREPEALVGKTIVIIANLAPAKLRGEVSAGMMLAAGGRDGVTLGLLTPDADVPPGTRIS